MDKNMSEPEPSPKSHKNANLDTNPPSQVKTVSDKNDSGRPHRPGMKNRPHGNGNRSHAERPKLENLAPKGQELPQNAPRQPRIPPLPLPQTFRPVNISALNRSSQSFSTWLSSSTLPEKLKQPLNHNVPARHETPHVVKDVPLIFESVDDFRFSDDRWCAGSEANGSDDLLRDALVSSLWDSLDTILDSFLEKVGSLLMPQKLSGVSSRIPSQIQHLQPMINVVIPPSQTPHVSQNSAEEFPVLRVHTSRAKQPALYDIISAVKPILGGGLDVLNKLFVWFTERSANPGTAPVNLFNLREEESCHKISKKIAATGVSQTHAEKKQSAAAAPLSPNATQGFSSGSAVLGSFHRHTKSSSSLEGGSNHVHNGFALVRALRPMAAEYLLASVLLKLFDGKFPVLDEESLKNIFSVFLSFALFSAPKFERPTCAQPCYEENRQCTMNVLCQALRQIASSSASALEIACDMFLGSVKESFSEHSAQQFSDILTFVVGLPLDITQNKQLAVTMKCIEQLSAILFSCKRKERDNNTFWLFFNSLTKILVNVSTQRPCQNCEEFYALMNRLWEWGRAEKTSRLTPLLTVVLCCSDSAFFLARWRTDLLEQLLRSKNRTDKELGLDSVSFLLRSYFFFADLEDGLVVAERNSQDSTKISEQNDDSLPATNSEIVSTSSPKKFGASSRIESADKLNAVQQQQVGCSCNPQVWGKNGSASFEPVEELISLLFPPNKKVFLEISVITSRSVDIICSIAGHRVDFAVQRIIIPFLAIPDKLDALVPERIAAALESLFIMYCTVHEGKFTSMFHGSGIAVPGRSLASKNGISFRWLRTTACFRRLESSLPVYTDVICDAIRRVEMLFSASRIKETRSLCGKPAMQEIEEWIFCISAVFPSNKGVRERLSFLIDHFSSCDTRLHSHVSSSILYFFILNPECRGETLDTFIHALLNTNDAHVSSLTAILDELSQILSVWMNLARLQSATETSVAEEQEHYPKYDTEKLESVLLVFLCSPLIKIRCEALKIIHKLEQFCRLCPCLFVSRENSLSDILRVCGEEALSAAYDNDDSATLNSQSSSSIFERVQELCSTEDQEAWICFISYFSAYMSDIRPDLVRTTWNYIVTSRLDSHTEAITHSSTPTDEHWWKAYASAAFSAIPAEDCLFAACNISRMTKNSYILSSRDNASGTSSLCEEDLHESDLSKNASGFSSREHGGKKKSGKCCGNNISSENVENSESPAISVLDLFKAAINAYKYAIDVGRNSMYIIQALCNCHPRAYSILFHYLTPLVNELSLWDGKIDRVFHLRATLPELLLHLISKMPEGVFLENTSYVNLYLCYINSEVQSFQLPGCSENIWDGLLPSRLAFTKTVKIVMDEVAKAPKVFEAMKKQQRRQLFRLLAGWSAAESVFIVTEKAYFQNQNETSRSSSRFSLSSSSSSSPTTTSFTMQSAPPVSPPQNLPQHSAAFGSHQIGNLSQPPYIFQPQISLAPSTPTFFSEQPALPTKNLQKTKTNFTNYPPQTPFSAPTPTTSSTSFPYVTQIQPEYRAAAVEPLIELEHASLSAITALRQNLSAHHTSICYVGSVLTWISTIIDPPPCFARRSDTSRMKHLRAGLPQAAVRTLSSFLDCSHSSFDCLFWSMIQKCYSPQIGISAGFLEALTIFLKKKNDAYQHVTDLVAKGKAYFAGVVWAGLVNCGSSNERLRKVALHILRSIYDGSLCSDLDLPSFGIEYGSRETRKLSQIELSRIFAQHAPGYASSIILESLRRVDTTPQGLVKTGVELELLQPWVATIDLSINANARVTVVQSMLALTQLLGSAYAVQLHQLWAALGSEFNVGHIISAILALQPRKGADLLLLAKFICVDLAKKEPRTTIDCLVGELLQLTYNADSRACSPNLPRHSSSCKLNDEESLDSYYAKYCGLNEPSPRTLDTLLPDLYEGVLPPLTRPDFVLVLLGEISCFRGSYFRPRLAQILHVLVLGFDFPALTVYEHCKVLLVNLVYGIVIQYYENLGLTPMDSDDMSHAIAVYKKLCGMKPLQRFGNKGNNGNSTPTSPFIRTPRSHAASYSATYRHFLSPSPSPQISNGSLSCLLSNQAECKEDGIFAFIPDIARAFDTVMKDLNFRTRWLDECHSWVTGCAQIPQAIRSCRIYRQILESHNEEQVLLILERVSRIVSSRSPEIGSGTLVQECLQAVIASLKMLDPDVLSTKTHYFNVGAALLMSDVLFIYAAALPLVEIFVFASKAHPDIAAEICGEQKQQNDGNGVPATQSESEEDLLQPSAKLTCHIHDVVKALVRGVVLDMKSFQSAECLVRILEWPWEEKEDELVHTVVIPLLSILLDIHKNEDCVYSNTMTRSLAGNSIISSRYNLSECGPECKPSKWAFTMCRNILCSLCEKKSYELLLSIIMFCICSITSATTQSYTDSVVALLVTLTGSMEPRSIGAYITKRKSCALFVDVLSSFVKAVARRPSMHNSDIRSFFTWVSQLSKEIVFPSTSPGDKDAINSRENSGMNSASANCDADAISWVYSIFKEESMSKQSDSGSCSCAVSVPSKFGNFKNSNSSSALGWGGFVPMKRVAGALNEVLQSCQALSSPCANEIRSSDTHNNPHLAQQHFFLDTASETALSLRICYSGISDEAISAVGDEDDDEFDVFLDGEENGIENGGDDIPIPGIDAVQPLSKVETQSVEMPVPIPGIEFTNTFNSDIYGMPIDAGGEVRSDGRQSLVMRPQNNSALAFPDFQGLDEIFVSLDSCAKDGVKQCNEIDSDTFPASPSIPGCSEISANTRTNVGNDAKRSEKDNADDNVNDNDFDCDDDREDDDDENEEDDDRNAESQASGCSVDINDCSNYNDSNSSSSV